MPPPIQSQGGSRAALITWTVITSILFVVSTVLAIFAHVDRNKILSERDALVLKYNRIINESDLTTDVGALKATQDNDATRTEGRRFNQDMKLINIAVAQRDGLVKVISGPNASTEEAALTAAADAMKAIANEKGIKVSAQSLTGAISDLIGQVKERQSQIDRLQTDAQTTTAKLKKLESDFTEALTKHKQSADEQTTVAQTATAEKETIRTDNDKKVQDVQAKMDEQSKLATDTINQLTAQGLEKDQQIKARDNTIKGLQNKLEVLRLPVDQIIRQADAKIMRIAADNIVYIDLGSGDQVVPGMSFEVYDRAEGIPKSGDPTTDEELPKGKASIEILKVTPGASECRIIRATPGQQVVEGDVCVNVVYDRNAKYNVMVYGSFDLDRNGAATSADADVIKRLVTQWGGKVAEQLNVETDFLVMGKAPEVPNYSPEELADPVKQFEQDQKRKELQEYEDLLARAVELRIPVLNQNRFLYFSGYFEQSAR